MPLNRYQYFAPLHAIARRINNRRLTRQQRLDVAHLHERLSDLSSTAWTEHAHHVPPAGADDLAEARRYIKPDLLPTPIRASLRRRCAHQREALVLRYLQTGSANSVVPTCSCSEARKLRASHPITPAGIVRPLSLSAWADFETGEYGGEGQL